MELIDAAAQQRLEAALAGDDGGRQLTIGHLCVGDWGVLDVAVEQVHPSRPFSRKNGAEGMVGRVTLRDASGAIDMVLWDDEVRLTVDGPLTPGTRLGIRGATVKAGWKGGLELGLGSAVLEPRDAAPVSRLQGILVERSEAVIVGDPPRCKVEALVRIGDDEVTVVCWDDAIKDVQVPLGSSVSLHATPHPALDGYFIA